MKVLKRMEEREREKAVMLSAVIAADVCVATIFTLQTSMGGWNEWKSS